MAKRGLGKGLGALMGQEALADPKPRADLGETVQELKLNQIEPSSLQPRKTFSEEQLQELSDSIRQRGIIQPLIVRKAGSKFELIAGERRWRAARLADRATAPVIVRVASDLEVLEMAMVENLQRADLNPVEEADGYALLAEKFKLTQEQIAKKVGKSRAAVANALRLRALPKDVKALLRKGQLTVGHAKVLLSLATSEEQDLAALEIVKKGLPVRGAENLVRKMMRGGSKRRKKKGGSHADWRQLEQELQRALGTKVRIVGTGAKGKIELDYYTGSDLDRLVRLMGAVVD